MVIGQSWFAALLRLLVMYNLPPFSPARYGVFTLWSFPGGRRTINPAVMAISKKSKTWFGKTSRSERYRFISPALPFRPCPPCGFDTLGCVTVLALWALMLCVMRLLLAN
jgi:hypothetical protein